MKPNIIFCSEPISPKACDMCYTSEFNIATKLGYKCSLVSYEDVISDKLSSAIAKAKMLGSSIYRGWMLPAESYKKFYTALHSNGTYLINNPIEYEHCHHFIESYNIIKELTPRSICISREEINDSNIYMALESFGSKPVIVKDFVKSRKHEWLEACYMPNASDLRGSLNVINTFIERQGGDLQGGLVLREFNKLHQIGFHKKSNIPVYKEYRIVYYHNKPVSVSSYWDADDISISSPMLYSNESISLEMFNSIAENIHSNFFTMDIAQKDNGDWIIVELGDAQVAGLNDIDQIYSKISV